MSDGSTLPTRARRVLTFVAIVGILAASRPTLASVLVALPWLVAGEAIRVWAAGHLLKTQELVTDGPYRYTRNPLYLGRLLILVGLAIAAPLPYHAHWAVLAIGVALFFGYYLPRKERVEPTRLERHHGEPYRRYRRAVPALFPTGRPYAPGSGRWDLTRFRRNREHWMVLGLAAVVVAQWWRAVLGSSG